MGVKSCSRPKCYSIMCDTYVNSIGYICTDCKEEFKKFFSKEKGTRPEIARLLKEFMKTEKLEKSYADFINEITVDTFFDFHNNIDT
jgi:Na+-transporting NADH:ubiquinone oxidoreductase subunit NqrC